MDHRWLCGGNLAGALQSTSALNKITACIGTDKHWEPLSRGQTQSLVQVYSHPSLSCGPDLTASWRWKSINLTCLRLNKLTDWCFEVALSFQTVWRCADLWVPSEQFNPCSPACHKDLKTWTMRLMMAMLSISVFWCDVMWSLCFSLGNADKFWWVQEEISVLSEWHTRIAARQIVASSHIGSAVSPNCETLSWHWHSTIRSIL